MEPLFTKVALLLTISMMSGAVGAYFGRFLRLTLGTFILLALLFIGGCFGVVLAAHASPAIGVTAMIAWTFISGLFIAPAIEAYAEELGWQTVALAYLGTSGVMAVCGAIGMFSGVNFGGMGGILSLALWALIIFGVVAIFVRMSREVNIAYSLIGMVVFAGYFLFDFFRLTKAENTWEAAINLTMALYLDFLNFFLDLLRLLALLSDHHK